MKTNSRIALIWGLLILSLGAILVVIVESVRGSQFSVLLPSQPISSGELARRNAQLQYLVDSPLILTGVVEAMHEIGWPHQFPHDGPVQLCLSTIHVEHVLKGRAVRGNIGVYWFMRTGSEGGLERMYLGPGLPSVFYLRQQAGEWRNAWDLYA